MFLDGCLFIIHHLLIARFFLIRFILLDSILMKLSILPLTHLPNNLQQYEACCNDIKALRFRMPEAKGRLKVQVRQTLLLHYR